MNPATYSLPNNHSPTNSNLHEPDRNRSDYVRLDANRLIAATPTAGVHHVIVLERPATSLTHYGYGRQLNRTASQDEV